MSHPVAWVTASPAWEGTPQPPAPEPMLLRFASDSFMEDVQGVLDRAPAALPALRAPKESFRARPLGKDDSWTPPEPPTLKLYQPIHGHFYLVAAALVCRLPGFPDHEVRPAQKEKVSFVLRRVVPGGELAWSTDPLNGNGWVASRGPIHALGKDIVLSAHKDRFKYPHGSLIIVHKRSGKPTQHFDKKSCLATFHEEGTYRIAGAPGSDRAAFPVPDGGVGVKTSTSCPSAASSRVTCAA